MPNRGAGAADTSDEGVGEGGENKGPVQKHLNSLRAQEGRFTSYDLGSVVLPPIPQALGFTITSPWACIFRSSQQK